MPAESRFLAAKHAARNDHFVNSGAGSDTPPKAIDAAGSTAPAYQPTWLILFRMMRGIAVHALGPPLQRSRQNCGKLRRLFPSHRPSRSFVVEPARGIRTINPGPPLDHVEVELQNAPLAEDEFGHRHQRGFYALADDGAAGSEKQVLDQLLCEGRGSARALAFHVFLGGDFNLMPIKAMMQVEARILGGDDSVLEIGRNLIEGNELVTLLVWLAARPGLHATLDLHRGRGRVDPFGGHQ